jgi:hypothetical protein
MASADIGESEIPGSEIAWAACFIVTWHARLDQNELV